MPTPCLLLAITAFGFSSNNQDIPPPVDSIHYSQPLPPIHQNAWGGKSFSFERHKWDISIDPAFFSGLFGFANANVYNPYNYSYNNSNYYNYGSYGYYGYSPSYALNNSRTNRIMLRRNERVYSPTQVPIRQGAYRIGLQLEGASETADTDSVQISRYQQQPIVLNINANSNHFLGASLGYEWQHQLNRFQLYYGYDAGARFRVITQNVNVSFVDANTLERSRKRHDLNDNTFSVNTIGFVGMKFYIHSRVSFGLESAFQMNYFWRNFDGIVPSLNYEPKKFSSRGFVYNIVPVSAVNFTFHFGSPVL